MRQLRPAGGSAFVGQSMWRRGKTLAWDATYADGGPRTAEGFCGAHVGRVVAVVGKDGKFSVGVEGAGDGGAERGMEGAARLCAKGDVRFERLSATEYISDSTRRALYGDKQKVMGREGEGTVVRRRRQNRYGYDVGYAPRCPRYFRLRWRS